MNSHKKLLNWSKIKQKFIDSDFYNQCDFNYFSQYCEIYCEEINEIYLYLSNKINEDSFGASGIDKFNLSHLIILHVSILLEIISNFYSCNKQSYKFKIYQNLFKKRDSKWVLCKEKLNDLNIFREVRKLIMHPLGYKNDTNIKKLKIIHHKDKSKRLDITNMKFNFPMPFWKIPPNTYENKNSTIILLIPVITSTKQSKIIEIVNDPLGDWAITDSPSYIMFLDNLEKFILEYINQCVIAIKKS